MFRRDQHVGQVVTAWRAERESVRAALVAEAVPASLGPQRGAWTVARVLVAGDRVLEPQTRGVVDLLDDVARVLGAPGVAAAPGEGGASCLVVCPGAGAPRHATVPPAGSEVAPARRAWADALAALDALDRLDAVLEAATPAAGARGGVPSVVHDHRTWAVAAALGLPAVVLDPALADEPAPAREVLVVPHPTPGATALVASATRVALREALVDGALLVTADAVDGAVLQPVAAGAADRRDPALVLWRQGDARGYQLVRRGRLEDSHAWATGWDLLPLDPDLGPEGAEEVAAALGHGEGDAALLLRALRRDADPVTVRALLRRPPSGGVLHDLCVLLGLPAEAADVVESRDPAGLPGSRRVEPGPLARTLLAAATAPRPDDPWFVRMGYEKPWWYRVSNVVWAPVAGVAAAGLADDGVPGLLAAGALAASGVAGLVSAVRPARRATAEPAALEVAGAAPAAPAADAPAAGAPGDEHLDRAA